MVGGGEVSKTCAVYCELRLRACPPVATAINMPHSEMCAQPMGSVNRFGTLHCPRAPNPGTFIDFGNTLCSVHTVLRLLRRFTVAFVSGFLY
jgi:hypothetical protein